MSDPNLGATLAMPCPGCGYKTERTLGWLLQNPHFVCGGCGKTLGCDPEAIRTLLAITQEAIDKIRRTFGKL